MREIQLGIVGLGTVGFGTLTILAENADSIAKKLGFPLRVKAVCSLDAKSLKLPMSVPVVTEDWRDVVNDPEVDIVAELIGGTSVARSVVDSAIAAGKHVVTANKELVALDGVSIWHAARQRGVTLAMEASVCGGIPIHAVLREGIAGDRVETLFGILNGTSNYILTEIEKHGTPFAGVLAEAQRLGYAEANPAADIEGFDARSKLVLLASLAFGVKVAPSAVATEGISRISPVDFQYAAQLGSTIKLLCTARREGEGLFLSVRPALIPKDTIIASVNGAYNAVWCRGAFGADTFYYGRGAGALPTGVAVTSDIMRLAREIQTSSGERVSPFAYTNVEEIEPLPIGLQRRPWYLRFRINDRPGIIASMAAVLAGHDISIDSVLQIPSSDKTNLPFVITLETTAESNVRSAVSKMAAFDFMVEPPLALPIEKGL